MCSLEDVTLEKWLGTGEAVPGHGSPGLPVPRQCFMPLFRVEAKALAGWW